MDCSEKTGELDLAARLETLLRGFEAGPRPAGRELVSICLENPSLFFGVAYRWMADISPRGAAYRFLTRMAVEERHLLRLFEPRESLTLAETQLLIRRFTEGSPGLEGVLLEGFLTQAGQGIVADGLFEVLTAIAGIDQTGRASSMLVRFLRSPNASIRSKASSALLKITRSAETAALLLSDPDGRVRANILESLWSQADAAHAREIFRQYAESSTPRIAANALIGLYLGGDSAGAIERIVRLAATPDPYMQRAAVWAMGYLESQEFVEPLHALLRSGGSALRGSILQALVRIHAAGGKNAQGAEGVRAGNSAMGKILLSGADEWNRWRKNCRESRPNLEGDSFYRMDLTGVDLSHCRLRGADFERATLHLGNLFGADLRDAGFRGAKLNRADLRNTQISSGTCFTEAEFRGACFGAELLARARAGDAWFDPSVADLSENGRAAEPPAA